MSGSTPYLAAGFVLTWGALALYAWRLEARVTESRRRLERRSDEAPGRSPAGGEDPNQPATAGTPTEENR